MNSMGKGLLGAFSATAIWAVNYLVSRALFGEYAEKFNEFFISVLHCILTVLCLLPFTFRNGDWQLFRRNWRRDGGMFLLLGFFVFAEMLCVFVSAKYTTAARSSLMANTSPVFTLLISFLAAKESLNGRKITGMLMGLTGVMLLGSSGGGDMFFAGGSMIFGDLLALISGVCWAAFTVFGSATAVKYGGMFFACLLRMISLLFILPLLVVFPEKITLQMPAAVWCGIAWLGIFPCGVAVALWSRGQKYLAPGLLGSFGYVSALGTVLLSAIVLGEKVTWQLVTSAVLIIAGVGLMMRHEK